MHNSTDLFSAPRQFLSREEYVYDTLRELVTSGQLRPQQELNQAELARRLGVSIIPVRSAISRLTAEGFLVQTGAYRSPQVFSLSKAELEEILIIGAHLEALATRQAIGNLTPADLAGLQVVLEVMQAAVQAGELLHFGQLNRTYHMAIYQFSHMPRLTGMIQDAWDKADIYRFRAMFDLLPELVEHTQNEHFELLGLISRGQAAAGAALMERHKEYSRRAFLLTYDSMVGEIEAGNPESEEQR